MGDGSGERRRWPRRELGVVVDVLEEVRGQHGRAVGMNLSRGGMLLQSLLDYREGERIDVAFLLPESSHRIRIAGRVLRVVHPETAGDEQAGVAIEFLDTPEWALAEVVRFVEGPGASLEGAVVLTKE
ncbi:MAG: PilZ domain-containing protein [Deltaproteobacteria bacterium]|nr:PilZ domain-containing protein [Deltaproteobacteria bacterium]